METPRRVVGGALRETDDEKVLLRSVPETTVTNVDLARRWRVLRLGCPAGCPLDQHEPPCHLAEVA
jgi:hypothetical protein